MATRARRCSTSVWMTRSAVRSASGCTKSAWCGHWSRPACAGLPTACAKSWWSKKSGPSSSSNSRMSCTTARRRIAPPCSANTATRKASAANGAPAAPPPIALPPAVSGKYGHTEAVGGEWSHGRPADSWLLRAKADLSPALVAQAIAERLKLLGVPPDVAARMDLRLMAIETRQQQSAAQGDSRGTDRLPWFCPGCPHNTSTRVPEGSIAMAGIGCHGMVTWMDRSTTSWTQMGGEGVPWIGQAPFSKRKHMFANRGDGTYHHSGLLAVRQSIDAGVNLTYKILFNSAVAMTGGQAVDGGQLGVPAMSRELAAEGARQIVVVTDEPAKYRGVADLAPG